jgi:hypothetical protein
MGMPYAQLPPIPMLPTERQPWMNTWKTPPRLLIHDNPKPPCSVVTSVLMSRTASDDRSCEDVA